MNKWTLSARPLGDTEQTGTRSVPVRVAIVIVGMHRSHTSALTRVLSLLGADLPQALMGAGRGNKTGHWEPQRLVKYHDHLLAELGSRWYDWRSLDLRLLPPEKREEIEHNISNLIIKEFGTSRLFLLKDPRICRFVPLYADALKRQAIEPRYAIPLRHPAAVTASLARRNGMTGQFASLLWLRHVLDAESATRGQPRIIFNSKRLLSDWRSLVRQVGTDLAITWPTKLDEAAAAIEGFLNNEFEDQVFTMNMFEPGSDVARHVAGTYRALQHLARDPSDDAAMAALDQTRSELDAAAPFADAMFAELVAREAQFAQRATTLHQRNTTFIPVPQSHHAGPELQALESALRQAQSSMQTARAAQRRLQRQIMVYENSVSWRITRPLRALKRGLPSRAAAKASLRSARRHIGSRWNEVSGRLRRLIQGPFFGRTTRLALGPSPHIWFVRGEITTLAGGTCVAIILHYDSLEDTRRCASSIMRQGADVRLAVVSNNESLADARKIAETFPQAIVVQAEENLGYAAGNNIGLWLCQQASCEFFWLLNPDIVVPDGYFRTMLEKVHRYPHYDFFGSAIVFGDKPSVVAFAGGLVDLDKGGRSIHLHLGQDVSHLPTDPLECDFLTGANIFGRTRAIDRVGYIPEDYFLYFEETDWFIKSILRGGSRPLIFPDLTLKHWKRSEVDGLPARHYLYYYCRNALIFGQRFAPRLIEDCEVGVRKFAKTWLNRIARQAPERVEEYRLLVERAIVEGRAGRGGRSII